MTIKIKAITEAQHSEAMRCDLSERLSAVIGQTHFVEVCAVAHDDGRDLATMTIARFDEGFDGVYNLTDFTENYTASHWFEVELVDGIDHAQVMSALIAHAVGIIGIDFSV